MLLYYVYVKLKLMDNGSRTNEYAYNPNKSHKLIEFLGWLCQTEQVWPPLDATKINILWMGFLTDNVIYQVSFYYIILVKT